MRTGVKRVLGVVLTGSHIAGAGVVVPTTYASEVQTITITGRKPGSQTVVIGSYNAEAAYAELMDLYQTFEGGDFIPYEVAVVNLLQTINTASK